MAEVNLNEPVDAIARQRLANQEFLAGQNQATTQFLDKFGNVIAGQGTTQGAAQRIGEELGLPQLRQNAFNLQQQLIDIPEVYNAGTRGFDVNANQLARIINQKTSEIAPFAQRATAMQQFGEQELGTRLGYLQNDWNRQLLPLNSEQAFLADRFARETSMFSQDNQRELDALLAKMNAGVQLSEGEKNRAQELAIAEAGYKNALEVARVNNQQNPWQSISSGGRLYNTATGQSIYGQKSSGSGYNPGGI